MIKVVDGAEFSTMLHVFRGEELLAGSGFMAPRLAEGSVFDEWRGQSDDLPFFVMARTEPTVDRVVATTDRGAEVVLSLSPVIEAFGMRFGASALPAGERPWTIRAEVAGEIARVLPQPVRFRPGLD